MGFPVGPTILLRTGWLMLFLKTLVISKNRRNLRNWEYFFGCSNTLSAQIYPLSLCIDQKLCNNFRTYHKIGRAQTSIHIVQLGLNESPGLSRLIRRINKEGDICATHSSFFEILRSDQLFFLLFSLLFPFFLLCRSKVCSLHYRYIYTASIYCS